MSAWQHHAAGWPPFDLGQRTLAATGAALALLTLVAVLLVVALVWLSWTRCAPSCL